MKQEERAVRQEKMLERQEKILERMEKTNVEIISLLKQIA
jgi:hypothetical protein